METPLVIDGQVLGSVTLSAKWEWVIVVTDVNLTEVITSPWEGSVSEGLCGSGRPAHCGWHYSLGCVGLEKGLNLACMH